MATTQVKLKGNPIELHQGFPEPGSKARDFTLTGPDLSEHSLSEYAGQRKVLSIIPSVDTGVCAASTRQFNQRATGLDNTVVLVISADLPFAAARFCGAEGLDKVMTLSTFRHPEFGREYGVSIQSGPMAGLCARAVLVLDENNKVIHAQLVDEITREPDYEAALSVLG